MIHIRANTRAMSRRNWRRRTVGLVAVLALLFGGLVPLVPAAGASGDGTLLAAICSPNGIRYVEIDLGGSDRDAPHAPLAGGLDHCPGCPGGAGSALLPVFAFMAPPLVADRIAPVPRDQVFAPRIATSFRPRAPPITG